MEDSLILHNRVRAENAALEAKAWAAGVERSTQVLYVDVDGSDDPDDHIIHDLDSNPVTIPKQPYKTIKAALARAKELIADKSSAGNPHKIAIFVNSGRYVEDNPLVLTPWTSISGIDLRTTDVVAQNSSEDLFHLNNGCYIQNIRPAGCIADDLNNPTKGAFFQFAPNAFITTSPYVQNCTASFAPIDKHYKPLDYKDNNPEIGNGPIGMIVDSERLNPYSPLQSMIIDAYTQVAFNGIGIVVRNKGYAQLVSFFTNFSHVGVWCINGGHASLLNSNTTFGDYGLRSSGFREYPNVDLSSVTSGSFKNDIDAITNIEALKNATLGYMINKLDNYSQNDYSNGTAAYDHAIKDGGILFDALMQDMSVEKPALIKQFIIGLYTSETDGANQGKIKPQFDPNLLDDFTYSFQMIEDYLISQNLWAPAGDIKLKSLIDVVINTMEGIDNENETFIKTFESLVTSTSHDFSYAGSGANFLGLPDHQKGNGETNYDIRVFRENGGRVAYTAGDEKGDFYIGDNLIIRNAEGDIVGRDFNKSVLRLVTGLILSLPKG